MYCRSLLKCIVILGDLAQFWQYISLTVLLKAHKKVTIQSDNTNCYLWHSKFHKWQPKFKVVGCQCMVGVMSHSRRDSRHCTSNISKRYVMGTVFMYVCLTQSYLNSCNISCVTCIHVWRVVGLGWLRWVDTCFSILKKFSSASLMLWQIKAAFMLRCWRVEKDRRTAHIAALKQA